MTTSNKQHNALPAGYTFEGYRIEKILGVGGFGITYRAVETTIEHRVAIKEYLPLGIAMRGTDAISIHPVSDGHEEDFLWGLSRFHQEAQTLVSFRHPNIIRVYRYFEANGTAYVVMEYQEGQSLAQLLEAGEKLDDATLRRLLLALLDGLTEVHAKGFLHRDIKPDNIYLRADGSPVLLDFGAARQALSARSQSMTAIVTRGYAPYEQYLSASEQGPWTDIYALAATAYQIVAGTPPTDSLERMKQDHLIPAVTAARGKYSENLLAAIDAGLRVNAEDRPQSIAEWRAILKDTSAATEAVPIARPKVENAAPSPTQAAVKRPARRRAPLPRAITAAVLLLSLSVVGMMAWSIYQDREEERIIAEIEAELRADAERRAREEARREAESRRKAQEEAEAAARQKAEQQAAADEARRATAAKELSKKNWIKDARGCAVWTSQPRSYLTVAWSGTCKDGKAHGPGLLQWIEKGKTIESIKGNFRNGLAVGKGIATYLNGERYEGEFNDGVKHGKGSYTWPDGDRYEGEFRDGVMHGRGSYAWLNGERYTGDFRNDKRNGKGVHIWPDGDRYEGDFRDGILHGKGSYTWADGEHYVGEYRDGKRHGQGVSKRLDGVRFEGEYRNDKRWNGVFTDPARGTIRFVNGVAGKTFTTP